MLIKLNKQLNLSRALYIPLGFSSGPFEIENPLEHDPASSGKENISPSQTSNGKRKKTLRRGEGERRGSSEDENVRF